MYKFFDISEFNCKCQRLHAINPASGELIKLLDDAREKASIPFKIVSGYRCHAHNKEVGGVADSAHIKGLAADISAITESQKFKVLTALMESGFCRIGIYKNFIHCDIDGMKPQDVIWIGGE